MTPQEIRIKVLEKQLEIAKQALTDVKNWNDDLDDEWDDSGQRAKIALKEIRSITPETI